MKIYIDTSVISGVFDKNHHRDLSVAFFNRAKAEGATLLISDLLVEELSESGSNQLMQYLDNLQGKNFITINKEVIDLANQYIIQEALTINCMDDARHIACATIYKADAIVSWNFRHIVNKRRKSLYNSVNLQQGYGMITIESPLGYYF